MAKEAVTGHVDAVSLCGRGKLGIDRQGGQSILGAGIVDQVRDFIEIR